MYLGYQNGKIKFYSETPLDSVIYALDKVEETQEKYVLSGDEYVLYDEAFKVKELEAAKEAKKLEASNKAYEYIESGALYKFDVIIPSPAGRVPEGQEGVSRTYHIEANDGNISKLGLALMELLLNQDTESTIDWCTYEDETVQLNSEMLATIVQGLKDEQTRVWIALFPAFLKEIEQAETLEDVNAVVIDYKAALEALRAETETEQETAETPQTAKTSTSKRITVTAPEIISVHSGGSAN